MSGDAQAGRDYYGSSAAPAKPVWVGERLEDLDYFQDRPERKALADAFGEGADGVIRQPSSVVAQALVGAGGVGKTRLAADFAEKAYADEEVSLVVWVNASRRPTIISTYADAANRVGASSSANEERAAEHFLSWLAKPSDRKWLVVLDDVDDVRELARLWPPQKDWGHTIITTRQDILRYHSSRQKVLDVGIYTPEGALQYLRSKLGDYPGALAGSEELARGLGYHPLALAIAAAYIRRVVETGSQRLGPGTCAEYADRFADQRTELTKILVEQLDGYERASWAAAWSISMAQVRREDKSGVARWLMVLLSLLDPNGIPLEILGTPETHGYLQARSTVEVNNALQTLRNLSLIGLGGADKDLVNIHALIQRAVRETEQESIERATRVLADSMSRLWSANQQNTVFAGLLRANAVALCEKSAGPLQTPKPHELLFQLGDGYGRAGLVEQAHQHFAELREQLAAALGADSPSTLRARERNAYWLGFSGKAGDALREFEAIAASQERTLGPKARATFRARHNVGRFMGRSGDPQGAVAYLERLVADETAGDALGPEHEQTLDSRNILGYWLNKAGRRQESLAYLRELLAFRSALHGCTGLSECTDAGILTTRIDLANTKADLKDYDGAIVLAETVVRDRKAVDGDDDPGTLSAGAYLACWQALRGDEDGVAKLEASVADHLRVLKEKHNNTLRVQAFLIEGLKASGRIATEEAIARMTSHLGVIHELLGLSHVTAMYCQEKLDEWQREEVTGRSEE